MTPLGPRDVPRGVPWSAVDVWRCPVCERRVLRRSGPGRQRVYCTNACRQFAYRWRRRRLDRRRTVMQAIRASTRNTHHAVRSVDDPVGDRVDGRGRHVAVCGAFARRSSDRPEAFGHLALIAVEAEPSEAHDEVAGAGQRSRSLRAGRSRSTGGSPGTGGSPRVGRERGCGTDAPRACRRCIELLGLPRHDPTSARKIATTLRSAHEPEQRRALDARRRRRARLEQLLSAG
ncbi:MAG: hypothetical protein AAFP84_15835, partial [Actinomycetota bacterium]